MTGIFILKQSEKVCRENDRQNILLPVASRNKTLNKKSFSKVYAF